MAKVKTGTLMKIIIPILVVLTAFMIVASIVMNMYPRVMSGIFGYGKTEVVVMEGTESLDAEYYTFGKEAESTTESKKNAAEVNKTIMSEGAVMLKNENSTLPLSKTDDKKITLLGYMSVNMKMSGGEKIKSENGASIDDALKSKGYELNPTTYDKYISDYNSGRASEVSVEDLNITNADEYPTAIVVLSRNSGEGNDQSKSATDSTETVEDMGTRTGLTPKQVELELLEYASKNFDNVIVLINASNAMELAFLEDGRYTDPYTNKSYDLSNIGAALWVGGVGNQGCMAIVDILYGDVNPSGHLADTYVRNHKADPTWNNFGDFKYTNSASAGSYSDSSYFVEYEEGIYVGYRYYETAAYEASKGNYSGFDYDEAVVYPFGHGLSYTTFEMKYTDMSYDEETEKFTFSVNVKNTGSEAGKAVVQIYCNPPYETGMAEKSHVVLAGFTKTAEIEGGKDTNVTVEVDREYLCTYDYQNAKSYILDAGDYNFYLSDNAHSWASIDKSNQDKCRTYTLDKKLIFNEENDGKRDSDDITATNVLDDETNWKFTDTAQTGTGLSVNMQRDNFKGTFPTAPTGDDYVAQQRVLDDLAKYDVTKEAKDEVDGEKIEEPITDYVGDITITLADLRGKDYDDEMWDQFIRQLSAKQLYDFYRDGGWGNSGIDNLGIPERIDLDGPYGFFAFSVSPDSYRWYQSEPVLAATWNVEMATLMGESIATEAWAHSTKESTGYKPFTGWYGPGANLHRSAFGGRNYEYYSEDPLLSGMMLKAETSAASENGMITYVKHFAANNQEQHRQDNGLVTWVNEQAMRELYLKTYEIYVKEATMTVKYYEEDDNGGYKLVEREMSAATGMMTAYNRIGATWAGACKPVTNTILRSEWGFTGISLTDAGGSASSYMNSDYGLRTGCTDLLLTSNSSLTDSTSDAAIYCLQRAVHRVLYNTANSNAMQGYAPGSTIITHIAPWQVMLIVLWIVVALLDVGGVVFLVVYGRKAKAKSAA